MSHPAAQAAPEPQSTASSMSSEGSDSAASARAEVVEAGEEASPSAVVARRDRQPVALHAPLRRLAAAAAITCALNGAAGYWVAQGDLGSTTALITDLNAHVQTIDRVVAAGPTSAREARTDATVAEAHTEDLALGARSITAAAGQAAAGPDSIAIDSGIYEDLAGAYTRYVSALEVARGAPAGEVDQAFAEAEQVRTNQVSPLLTDLGERGAARSDAADVASAIAYGVLALTTSGWLAGIVGGSVWLARRTKRVINPGLVAAGLVSAATSGYAIASLIDPAMTSGTLTAPALLLGGVAAAGLAWVGLSRRLKEYR